jgi:hypothetical protein
VGLAMKTCPSLLAWFEALTAFVAPDMFNLWRQSDPLDVSQITATLGPRWTKCARPQRSSAASGPPRAQAIRAPTVFR